MREESLGGSRLAAFSDGIFAVAITLLVLDLHVPRPDQAESLGALLRSGFGSYVVFCISFGIVGITWLNHHRLLARIRGADTTLIMLNLWLLFGVTIAPFTTALIARYLRTPDAAGATMLYGLVWMMNGLAYTFVLGYAQRRGLTVMDGRSASERRMLRLYALGPIGYALGAALAFVDVYAALALYVVVVSAYIIPPPRARRR